MPKLSIVVPVFNVAPYLDACLSSVTAQGYGDFDVVLVDDGSYDGSEEIVDRWAHNDARFRVVHQPNSGPGPGGGRNGGLAMAGGDYLMFLDSDDVLAPDALVTAMAPVAAEPGLDLVTFSVRRLYGAVTGPSVIHDLSHPIDQAATTAEASPWLMFDSTPWNKVFRRAFFDAEIDRWPAQQLYEDIEPMTRAHLRSSATAVSALPLYLWRRRGTGSITHPSASIAGDLAQIDRLLAVDGLVRREGNAELKRWLDWKALTSDFLWMLLRLPRLDPDSAVVLHAALRNALEVLDSDTVGYVLPALRRCYRSIGADSLPTTARVVRSHRLGLAIDRRTPATAMAGRASASMFSGGGRSGDMKIWVSGSGVDMRRSAVGLFSRAPWEPHRPDPDHVAMPDRPASRRAARFDLGGVIPHRTDELEHFYLELRGPGGQWTQIRRSPIQAAVAELRGSVTPASGDAVLYLEDQYVKLALGRLPMRVERARLVGGDLVLDGTGIDPDAEAYCAFLSKFDDSGAVPVGCELSSAPGAFSVVVAESVLQSLDQRPWYLTLAAAANPGVALAVGIRSPMTVGHPSGSGRREARYLLAPGIEANVFVQRALLALGRLRRLRDRAGAT